MDGLINNNITKLDIHKDWHYNVKMMNYTQDNINGFPILTYHLNQKPVSWQEL